MVVFYYKTALLALRNIFQYTYKIYIGLFE